MAVFAAGSAFICWWRQRDWYFIAEQSAPATHLAHQEAHWVVIFRWRHLSSDEDTTERLWGLSLERQDQNMEQTVLYAQFARHRNCHHFTPSLLANIWAVSHTKSVFCRRAAASVARDYAELDPAL